MLRRFLFIFTIAILMSACSSDPTVHAAFRKYSGKDGVTSMTIPGFAIRAFLPFAGLQPEEKELLRHVELVKILTIEEEQNFPKVNFSKEFSRYVPGSFQPLLSVKEDGDEIQILAQMKNEEYISELLILAGGSDNALIYVKGDFNLNQVASQINLMKNKNWKEMINGSN